LTGIAHVPDKCQKEKFLIQLLLIIFAATENEFHQKGPVAADPSTERTRSKIDVTNDKQLWIRFMIPH
jgi:hypothetical protein